MSMIRPARHGADARSRKLPEPSRAIHSGASSGMTSPRHRPQTAPIRPTQGSPEEADAREQGSLVVVQERVLGEIAHELGNFFHKLYYWSDFIKTDAEAAKGADSTVGHM